MISYFQSSIVWVLPTNQYRRCQPRGRHASCSLWTGTLTIIITHDLVFSVLDRVGPAYRQVKEMSAERKARILLLVDRDFDYYIITHDLVFSALDRVGPSYSPVQEMSAERKARILLLVDRDFDYYHNSWSRIFSPRSCWSFIQPSTGDVSREEGTHPPPCGQGLWLLL